MAKKWLFWLCEGSAFCVGAKPNVPLAGWLKLFLKNVRWEKNKKHRFGNECRLTRCPFVISFLCLWSPVKMVYFFLVLSRLFVVVGSSFTLAANIFIGATRLRLFLRRVPSKSYLLHALSQKAKNLLQTTTVKDRALLPCKKYPVRGNFRDRIGILGRLGELLGRGRVFEA